MPMLPLDFTKPVTILAPMAGYSDAPMRSLVSRYGACAVVSEMMASAEFKSGKSGVKEKAERGNLAPETAFIVQIAGRDPDLMVETAKFAQDLGADQIDINMGCPAKKVVSGATAGASLLLEPQLATEIIEKTAAAVHLPVSVKTRLGWDSHITKNMAKDFQEAGAEMLTIHARTRNQKYSGAANWQAVAEIKSRISIPVIVNGDITNTHRAKKALKMSNADGVMIGRASFGNPQIIAQIRSALRGTKIGQINNPILCHYQSILEYYGPEMGLLCARKHLKSYFKNTEPNLLRQIIRENDINAVIAFLEDGKHAA